MGWILLPIAGMFVFGVWASFHVLSAFWYALGPAFRMRITRDGLQHKGLWGSLWVKWDDVENIEREYRRGDLYLLIRVKGQRFRKKLVIWGLPTKPDDLIMAMNQLRYLERQH